MDLVNRQAVVIVGQAMVISVRVGAEQLCYSLPFRSMGASARDMGPFVPDRLEDTPTLIDGELDTVLAAKGCHVGHPAVRPERWDHADQRV